MCPPCLECEEKAISPGASLVEFNKHAVLHCRELMEPFRIVPRW
jgi:hypothetical protein